MMSRQFRSIGVLLLVSLCVACGRDTQPQAALASPLGPTTPATNPSHAISNAPQSGAVSVGDGDMSTPAIVEWRCLAPASGWLGTGCALSSRLHTASIGASALTVPSAPTGLTASVAGNRVTLSWTGDGSSSYIVEAGSAPGLSNLANADVGSANGLIADNVPAATYYVRVRARNAAGISGPSNEVIVVVAGGGGACNGAPNAPTALVASSSGSSVTLQWNAPSGGCAPSFYIIEAGSAPGLSNLATVNTSNAATTFSANGVGSGTYYVRVRAGNARGAGGSSNEAVLVVGSTPGGTGPGGPGSGGTGPTGGAATGRLAFSTTGSIGWSSIFITVNGQTAGTLTRYFEPGNPASCEAIPGARVVVTVPAGVVSYSARTDAGGTWSGTQAVAPNGCSEVILTCPNRNCGPTTPTGGSLSFRLYGGPTYGQFLGLMDCINCTSFNAQSINNEFGIYGSQFSSTSIWNQFSQYGSQFSAYSACNQFASQPPILVDSNGGLYGELTLNQFRTRAIRTPSIVAWLAGAVCRH
jgi:hypothetical protein